MHAEQEIDSILTFVIHMLVEDSLAHTRQSKKSLSVVCFNLTYFAIFICFAGHVPDANNMEM